MILATDNPSNRLIRQRKKKRRGCLVSSLFGNNDLRIKGKSVETQVEGCGMNSDKGKWKSFGLLKCKGETQESAVALIRLFNCMHSSLQCIMRSLHCVLFCQLG